MDATKKPLLISPNFSNYAEKKGIFELLQVSFKYLWGDHFLYIQKNSYVPIKSIILL